MGWAVELSRCSPGAAFPSKNSDLTPQLTERKGLSLELAHSTRPGLHFESSISTPPSTASEEGGRWPFSHWSPVLVSTLFLCSGPESSLAAQPTVSSVHLPVTVQNGCRLGKKGVKEGRMTERSDWFWWGTMSLSHCEPQFAHLGPETVIHLPPRGCGESE